MTQEDKEKLEELAATARAEQATRKDCDHTGWTFKEHGRVCWLCGTFIVDFGD